LYLSDPWFEFTPATKIGELRVRRVDDEHPFNFWWGRDLHGHHLLLFQSAQELNQNIKTLHIRGVSIDLTSHQFAIRLLQSSDIELFTTLCWSLIERTKSAKNSIEVQNTLISQLQRWQQFFGKSNSTLLSDQEIRGLFCELEFLRHELIPRFGNPSVHFWKGPQGEPQDFAIGNTTFEIKSHVIGSQPMIVISSPNQLLNTEGDLYLIVYSISEAPGTLAAAKSLTQQIKEIRILLEPSNLTEVFDRLLREVNYIEHPDYSYRFFTVAAPVTYLVQNTFPRIIPDHIPEGISRLKYSIELSACKEFLRDKPEWFKLGAKNGS